MLLLCSSHRVAAAASSRYGDHESVSQCLIKGQRHNDHGKTAIYSSLLVYSRPTLLPIRRLSPISISHCIALAHPLAAAHSNPSGSGPPECCGHTGHPLNAQNLPSGKLAVHTVHTKQSLCHFFSSAWSGKRVAQHVVWCMELCERCFPCGSGDYYARHLLSSLLFHSIRPLRRCHICSFFSKKLFSSLLSLFLSSLSLSRSHSRRPSPPPLPPPALP